MPPTATTPDKTPADKTLADKTPAPAQATTGQRARSVPLMLLVEDNPDDQDLARLAIGRLSRPCELMVADDGLDALAQLNQMRQTPNVALPDFALIDLSMPRLNGVGLLKALREDPLLQMLPAIVFTTSTAPSDLLNCYQAGCNSFLVKPMDISGLTRVFESLLNYWAETSRRPPYSAIARQAP